MSIYSKLSALLTAANTKTGESDTTLTDAVQTLIDGYGQGGGGDEQKYADVLARSSSLTSFESDAIITAGYMAFCRLANLETISLPNLESVVTGYTFDRCTNLREVYFPKLSVTDSNMLPADTLIQVIALPSCRSLANTVIRGAVLTTCDLGASGKNPNNSAPQIGSGNFSNSPLFNTLVIRNTTDVCVLARTTDLESGPFGASGAGGTLYVPNTMITAYQNNTNWAAILAHTNNSIKSIESTHTDPNAPIDLTVYYADGTVIPT